MPTSGCLAMKLPQTGSWQRQPTRASSCSLARALEAWPKQLRPSPIALCVHSEARRGAVRGLRPLAEHPSWESSRQAPRSQVQYAWVRLNRTDGGGDSKRVKFVLLTWSESQRGVPPCGHLTPLPPAVTRPSVGEVRCAVDILGESRRSRLQTPHALRPSQSAGAMSKARVCEHKASLAAVKSTHVTLDVDRESLKTLEGASRQCCSVAAAAACSGRTRETLTLSKRCTADVDAALRKAGGADYDAGNEAAGVRAGSTSAIKSQSRAFFQQKDKETEIKGIQFEKVCDDLGRVRTSAAADRPYGCSSRAVVRT